MRHARIAFAADRRRRRRKGGRSPNVLTGVAVGVAATMFMSSAASAAGLEAYPDDAAEAGASVIGTSILGQDIAGGAQSEAGYPTNPGPNREGLNLTLLGGEVIDLGGLAIPIDEFIDYGQVGVLLSESTTTDGLNAEAISGLAGGDGALTLDGANADFGAASFDLLTLFREAGVGGVTDLLVDEATLLLGAGGAHVVAENGEFLDQDGVGGAGQYRAGEASLLLHSPAVDEAAGMIYDTIGTIDDEMETQVNNLLDLTDIISALPGGVTVDATVESNMQEEIFAALLAQPITTNNKFLTVDFSTGTVTLQLDQLLSGELRPGDPTGMNSQNPNTELIDDELYPMIAENVHEVMEEVTNIVVGAIEGALASVTVHLSAALDSPAGAATATWNVNLMGDLTDIDCTSTGLGGGLLCTTLTTAVNVLGPVVSTVVEPIRDFIVGDAGQQIFDLLIRDIKTGGITVPIRMALEPFIELLAQVVSLQLNHQVTEVCTAPDGTELTSSLEVSAISLGLVQAVDGARLSLGTAGVRVDACELAAGTPSLEVSSPVPAGTDADVTSGGWAPESEVSLQLTDGDGNPVGDPVVVTTDAEGDVPAGTVVPVPADATPGDYTVVGSDADGNTAEGTVTVYAPVLEVETPAAPGVCAVVTSSGWVPGSQVTVQLTDADGNPVGDPVVATADADGHLPADTCILIPEDATPGDYTVVGSDDTGAEVTTPVEVSDDATVSPSLEVSSPVPAGTDADVTSDGWTPESEVSLQLTDGDGNPVGDPVVATTDENGNVPAGTVIPVPEDATPGDYTVVGSDADGNTAEGTVTVYAPVLEVETPAAPGVCAVVTSSGWVPGSQVTVQLTDADGNPVGDPVVATADADGHLPADTCILIPEDATPGDYTVVGSDDTGAEVTTPVEVSDDASDAPSLEVASPVPAGECAVITSTGWAPAAEVTIQLTDADGNAVGDPVVVTADADGNLPADTCVVIPEDATPGDYTVVGSDADGNTAEGTVTVYAPVLEVETPAAPGVCAVVTSSGWVPGSQVTVQLTDADGNPVGDPVVATADADGNLPADTCILIPEDATPGDYTVVGSDDTGAEVTTPVEVSDDATGSPSLEATSPVPAGGETAVTSGGWAPDSEVSLQLTDGEGNPVGDPVVVTADENGNVPAGTVVPVPADAGAGDYTVVGSDADGNTAEGTVTVYAPVLEVETPIAPGGESDVTSGGWLPDTEVTLVLEDADGNPVGDPVVVTTDENGNVPAGTTISVPEDAAPGSYTVVGSDDNGAEAIAPVIITDADGSTCAADAALTVGSSSVVPGDTVTVTGTGFTAGATATVQLNDADGNPLLDPALTIIVGVDCGFVIDVVIPGDAAAGDHEIAVEDDGGNAAVIRITIGTEGGGGDGDGTLTATLLKPTVEQGGDQRVTGLGFAAGEAVVISDGGVVLTTVTADAEGQVVHSWTVSETAKVGASTVILTGDTSGSVDVSYQIVASGSLATTGSDVWSALIPVALLLMVLGGAFVATRRREVTIEQ